MNSSGPVQNSPELLQRLLVEGFEFVVVGGVAAIAHGSAQFTKDLDVAAPFDQENIARLMRVVRPLHPRFYQTMGKPLVTRDDADLATFKNLYFSTDFGIIDVLGSTPPVGGWAEISRNAVEITLFERRCKIIGLDDLIAVKAHVGRPKDKLVEAELRAVRERLHRPGVEISEAIGRLRARGFHVEMAQASIGGSFPLHDDQQTVLPDGRTLFARRNSFSVVPEQGQWVLSVSKAGTAEIPDSRHQTLQEAIDRLLLLFP